MYSYGADISVLKYLRRDISVLKYLSRDISVLKIRCLSRDNKKKVDLKWHYWATVTLSF